MPTAKDCDAEVGEDDEELDAHEARRFRRMAATINYLASARLDLQFTASILGRTMARPTTRSWSNLKKAARYLKEHPRVKYEWSRRSMSGGMIVVGGAVIKSSGEAEFCSAGKAAAELIGIKSMMRDMGWDADIKLHVDATVAQAMANRQWIDKDSASGSQISLVSGDGEERSDCS